VLDAIIGAPRWSVQYLSQGPVRGFSTIIELRHLRYFIAVAEELNFTRAAERVGIGQPPLSQQIRALEERLGAKLFRRLPHGVELTEAGKALIPEARDLLARAENVKPVVQRAAEGGSGRVRIGFTSSASFHPIVADSIREFRRRWPSANIALKEANTSDLLDELGNGDIDAAFIRPGGTNPVGFSVLRLAGEPSVFALPTTHRLAGAASLPLDAVAAEDILLAPRAAGPELFDSIVSVCRQVGFEPSIVYQAPQITSIVNFVAAGLGVAIVAVSMTQIRVPGVVFVPIEGVKPIVPLALATRPRDANATTKNYVIIVKEQLRSEKALAP
jgi:DNA-binding transcriptional LysR family regulator